MEGLGDLLLVGLAIVAAAHELLGIFRVKLDFFQHFEILRIKLQLSKGLIANILPLSKPEAEFSRDLG
jgi:hypothetical protein